MNIIDKIPENIWLTRQELAKYFVINHCISRYINQLVAENKLQRDYRYIGKKRMVLYFRPKLELKKRKNTRKCLRCGQLFEQKHRFNFLCCLDSRATD